MTSNSTSQRKRILSALAIFFMFIAFVYLLYWLFIGQFYETTDDAYVSGNLVQVMPQISGQVTAILVDVTDFVEKGQPVAKLDKADTQIALQNAQSHLALTVRQVSQLYQKAIELQTRVRLQQANLEKAQEDYRRRQGLVAGKTISTEDLHHAKLAAISAADSLALVNNQLASLVVLISKTDLYHHPQVQQAADQLRKAYLAWERTTIYAPETGYIAKRPVEVGQQVTSNTVIMVIVPLDQVWVDANFKESQLKNFHLGQPAKMIADAYGDHIEFQGTVAGLSPGTGSAFALLPPQNATGNWIKIVQRLPVRIKIDADQLKKYPLRLGLSMSVSVNTHKRNGSVLTTLQPSKILYRTQDYSHEAVNIENLINQILTSNAKNVSYSAAVTAN